MKNSQNLQSCSLFDLEELRIYLWKLTREHANSDWINKNLLTAITTTLGELFQVETYWAYPGREVLHRLYFYLENHQVSLFKQLLKNVITMLETQQYRSQAVVAFGSNLNQLDLPKLHELQTLNPPHSTSNKKTYFEVLVVHPYPLEYDSLYRNSLANFKTDRDEFIYDILFVNNAEDAMVAILANPSIQSVVFLAGFQTNRENASPMLSSYKSLLLSEIETAEMNENPVLSLACAMDSVRPELDQYFICETPLHELSSSMREQFQRILYHIDPFQNLHHAILNGIRDRYSTPFFHALQAYSRKPHGMFHALPLSQGKSVQNSHWIRDMLEFYGENTFLAETSSTQGGLDSLLDPKGAIKQTHRKIATTFGSKESYLVTNGTSTSNKIVMQATLMPGDIVIISADCHKSIPYSVMLTGALPVFLETYPLRKHDLYGGVTLQRIKEVMLDLKERCKLHLLKQITLTNSTFDGLIYNTERFMLDILAIKPDIIFHWDEAWFAFGHFNPIYHGRTAMMVTQRLKRRLQSKEYIKFYNSWKRSFQRQCEKDSKAYLTQDLYPDPDQTLLRVYATQSTHKTLTSFRQGSMIHIDDINFDTDLFLEAYRMHTSTSPNYQILASLDVGRRQVSLEGYERVKNTIYLALELRKRITRSSVVSRYFKVLGDEDLVPQKIRSTAKRSNSPFSYCDILANWGNAEFAVDPTRVTVDVSLTGMDGSSFRQLLMNAYNIQVNKTSRNTVLFIVNIGSTMGTINYLIGVLENISEKLQQGHITNPPKPIKTPEQEIDLPQKRIFSKAFKPFECSSCDIGDIREAYYAAAVKENVEYVPLNTETIKATLNDRKLVSAAFVTPYPPGFPILTPGQMITYDILLYLQKMNIKEIHGYYAELGLKIFKTDFLSTYGT